MRKSFIAFVVVICLTGAGCIPKNAHIGKTADKNQAFSSGTERVSVSSSAAVDSLPTAVGQCTTTTVAKITTRLTEPNGKEIPNTGSAIEYTNGGYQVSYDTVPGIENSIAGDKVTLCLVSVPEDCPPRDERGKIYHATNLRTAEQWEESDAEHSCGGA